MKKLKLKSKKLLWTFFCCISLVVVTFVFKGCYMLGTDGDYLYVRLVGTVESKTTKSPIKGIKIDIGSTYNYVLTDENGNFDFYAFASRLSSRGDDFYKVDTMKIKFLDIDGIENGSFADTTIIINHTRVSEVAIFMKMEEKQ